MSNAKHTPGPLEVSGTRLMSVNHRRPAPFTAEDGTEHPDYEDGLVALVYACRAPGDCERGAMEANAARLALCWNTHDQLVAETAMLRDALLHAVSVIRDWHNADIPMQQQSGLWGLYWLNAPEMKPIRAAL